MFLSEINIYPIKSLKGISLKNAVVEKRGLQFDRRWMLVDEQNVFFTQREYPKMATISIALDSGGLHVGVDGFEDLFVPFEPRSEEKIKVQVWKSICDAIVSENQTNEWFSEVLQTKCRLVYMPDDSEREVNPFFNRNNDIVSFADGYPFLLIGENSLADLNGKLEDPLPMNRFRPNFVIRNLGAFDEDNWKTIKIGETIFRSTKPCARCVVTTIDQTEGVPIGKEPLRTLTKYRLAKNVFPAEYESLDLNENAVLFGQNLIAENNGNTIKIGDKVEVLA